MHTRSGLSQRADRKSNIIGIRERGGLTELYRSADERRAEGKRLRDIVPCEAHSGWKTPRDRRDPIDLLIESNQGRMPQLVPIRHGRMLESPFAFYRGSAALMASDLARTPTTGLRVQACGDAHLQNFGGFATPERNVIFDINDFDETLPAPWEWDLKRLAASVVVAGRHLGLRESHSARAARATVRSYREHITDYSAMRALEVWYDRIDIDKLLAQAPDETTRKRVGQRIDKARARTIAEHDFPKLAEQRGSTPLIKDDPPLVFHPAPKESSDLGREFSDKFALYREALSPSIRPLFGRFHFCDLAIKVVGVGSVGTRCSIALFLAADDDPLFLQMKEARASILEPYAGKSAYPNHGQRVVVGQRMMQAAIAPGGDHAGSGDSARLLRLTRPGLLRSHDRRASHFTRGRIVKYRRPFSLRRRRDGRKMDTLGITLIVGGLAFLCSGLVFLLPSERIFSSSKKSVEESRDEIEHDPRRMREERGEL